MAGEPPGVPPGRARARDLGIRFGRFSAGRWNALTDVPGVRVGHTTLIAGDGALVVGHGPVRTGVTVVLPPGDVAADPVFAGSHILNGAGEMTGLAWIDECGQLESPIAITTTHSVGVVRDAMIAHSAVSRAAGRAATSFSLPVVAETWDGFLNDANGMHVTPAHVSAALDAARDGPVPEGCVGGGTGMICHGFKGGIGSASRALPPADGGWIIGVLVQANYGSRHLLRIDGVPVGQEITPEEVPLPGIPHGTEGAGSIIVIIATDAPLLPIQCRRLAQRATLGIARMGGLGAHPSGDLFLALSTANRGLERRAEARTLQVEMVPQSAMTTLFEAVAEATEEAIANALCTATTMTGADGRTAHAIPLDRLCEIMRRYHRLSA